MVNIVYSLKLFIYADNTHVGLVIVDVFIVSIALVVFTKFVSHLFHVVVAQALTHSLLFLLVGSGPEEEQGDDLGHVLPGSPAVRTFVLVLLGVLL